MESLRGHSAYRAQHRDNGLNSVVVVWCDPRQDRPALDGQHRNVLRSRGDDVKNDEAAASFGNHVMAITLQVARWSKFRRLTELQPGVWRASCVDDH